MTDDELRRLGRPRVTDELRALLLELAEYLGDRPRSDAAAWALYRRVLEMLGEGEAK